MTRFALLIFTLALLAVLAALLGLFGALGSYASGLATGFIYGALTTAALLACIAFGRRAGRAVALDEPDAGSGLALVPTSARLAAAMARDLERGAMFAAAGRTVKRERDGVFLVTQNDYTGMNPWPFSDAQSAVSFCACCAPLEQWQFVPTDVDGRPSRRTARRADQVATDVVRVERPRQKQLTMKGGQP